MMQRRVRPVMGALIGVLLVASVTGCSDDSGRLRSGLEELSSVGAPDGYIAGDVEIVGCDDRAEMAAGYANFDRDGAEEPDTGDVDSLNAEWARVRDWYEPRWQALGWTRSGSGDLTKTVNGKRLRAFVDGVNGSGYAIGVVRVPGKLCA